MRNSIQDYIWKNKIEISDKLAEEELFTSSANEDGMMIAYYPHPGLYVYLCLYDNSITRFEYKCIEEERGTPSVSPEDFMMFIHLRVQSL